VVSRPVSRAASISAGEGVICAPARCARADQQLQHGLADLLGPAGVDLQAAGAQRGLHSGNSASAAARSQRAGS
jgi:hypothetical protein